jgi:hypothetical protein
MVDVHLAVDLALRDTEAEEAALVEPAAPIPSPEDRVFQVVEVVVC